MRFRNDFVTNSSSSSFVMAFKNDEKWESYEHFKDMCEYLDYMEFYNLIEEFIKVPGNTDKEKALDWLRNELSWEYRCELLDSLVVRGNYENITEYYSARNFLEDTDEFKQKIDEFLEKNDVYKEKKRMIEEADLVVVGTIWDTSGGVIEWAIRNGFIEDTFGNNHVITWNVG